MASKPDTQGVIAKLSAADLPALDERLVQLLKDCASKSDHIRIAPWEELKYALAHKFEEHIRRYEERNGRPLAEFDGTPFRPQYEDVRERLLNFTYPPFTTQRMCELALDPDTTYKLQEKFYRAFSKLILGISTCLFPEQQQAVARPLGGHPGVKSIFDELEHSTEAPMEVTHPGAITMRTNSPPPPSDASPSKADSQSSKTNGASESKDSSSPAPPLSSSPPDAKKFKADPDSEKKNAGGDESDEKNAGGDEMTDEDGGAREEKSPSELLMESTKMSVDSS